MKTQKQNGLQFTKGTIVELNSDQLNDVNGGSSAACAAATTSVSCAAVAVSVTLSQMAYDAGHAVGGAISRLFD